MSMRDPGIAEQQLVQAARALEGRTLEDAERRAEFTVGGLAVAACALLWLFPVTGGFDLLALGACAIGMLIARTARFEVGGGFTEPVQLAFVPLLFAVPAQVVPLVVIAVMVSARLPAVVKGTVPPGRLAIELGNAWFAIGAAVFLIVVGGTDAVLAQPALAIAVVGGQFCGDLAASALREALLRRLSLEVLLEEVSWVYAVDAVLTAPPLWMIVNGGDVAISVLVLVPLIGVLGLFAHEREKRLDSLFELNDAYHGTALLLGDVVEADDSYTGRHSRGVLRLALTVGCELELDADRLRNLEFSALLHDVGKVSIPKEIINKPGKLDAREWDIVKTHTAEGQRMLDQIGGFMGDVGRIVRAHHERWDGCGYPDGIAGEEIPLEARIITACDAYNAMTTDRPYRRALPVTTAIDELSAHTGTQFDPEVVHALMRVLARARAAEDDRGRSAARLRAA